MELNWSAIAVGSIMLLLGIGMLFLEQTQNIAPFLIGFGAGRLATAG